MTNERPDRPSQPGSSPSSGPDAVPTEAPAGIPAGTEPPPPRARLTRSRTDRMLAGVAGGLGEYFEVDATLVRAAVIVLTIMTGGAFALLYIAAIVIMPRGTGESSPVAEGIAIGSDGSNAITILFGLILIAVGVAALVEVTELAALRWDAVLAAILALVGLAILFESRHGVHGGLVTVGILLTAILAVASALPNPGWDGGFGDRSVRPTTITSLDREYEHAFGSMVVDLREVPFPDGETRLRIAIAFGELGVHVPPDVAVRVTGHTMFGSSSVLGRQHDGLSADIEAESADYATASRRVRIELSNTFGSASVRR